MGKFVTEIHLLKVSPGVTIQIVQYWYYSRCPQDKVYTTVDDSLMWTLLAQPLGVHIRGILLYTLSQAECDANPSSTDLEIPRESHATNIINVINSWDPTGAGMPVNP